MSKYLNRSVRESVIIIDVLIDYTYAILQEWRGLKSMKDEKVLMARLKQGCTLMYNTLTDYLTQFPNSEIQTMIRQKDSLEMVLMPKETAKEIKKLPYACKDEQQAFAFVEGVLEGFCRNCKKDHTQCDIKELFLAWNVPLASEETDGCPYKP